MSRSGPPVWRFRVTQPWFTVATPPDLGVQALVMREPDPVYPPLRLRGCRVGDTIFNVFQARAVL